MTSLATSASAHTGPLPRWWSGPAYGLLGLPLAFVALPLYVVLPHHYATTLGLPLASVGALLMLVRLLDAAAEPLLGRWSDHLYQGPLRMVLWVAGGSALVQLLGLAGLFFPAVQGPQALAAWMVAGLLLTCLAHSQLVIAHQAWGAEPMLWVFALALWMGWLALWWAPRPVAALAQGVSARLPWSAIWQPLRQIAFRRLLAVFVCNGIASAIPAALMLFFAQDRLQATQEQIALFLVLYFVSGALSMPGWLRVVRRWGLERAWLGGMLLAIACFGWTTFLSSGQIAAFALICALSGIALGADLALPGALLARLVERHGAQGRSEGAYLGWWNLATKLNLALAAGAALPLLQWGGYSPGTLDAQGLQRLAWAYAVLPCALKLLAAALLYRLLIRPISLLPDPGVAP